jgi:hypothetical protein
MTRHNFTTPQQRDIRKRSGDICEAGKFETHAFYGMAPGETCERPAEEIDHITADGLKRTHIKDIDEGLHVCKLHHKIKTPNDKRKIAKAKRLDEARVGITRHKQTIAQRNSFKKWKSNSVDIRDERT